MNRETLLNSSVFRTLSAEDVMLLLCCVAARYEELENNRRFLLTRDDLAVALFGELSFGSRPLFAGETVSGEGMLHAFTQSGFLVISRSRIATLCKNACPCHRRAIVAFAAFIPDTIL